MSHKLLIRLKNNAKDAPLLEWASIFDDGTIQVSTSVESNDELVQFANIAQQIIVLVPSINLFITQVKLPKLSSARLAKAIPFALEDQITEDAFKLHFAVNMNKEDPFTSVAVVDKAIMDDWKAILASSLQNASQKVKVLLPDIFALPWQDNSFYILIEQELAIVRTSQSSGFVIEKKELFPVLLLHLNQSARVKPNRIKIDNSSTDAIFSDDEAAQLNVPIEKITTHNSLLSYMSERLKEPAPINLLQGNYAPAHKKMTMDQLIWVGLAIVGAWMAVATLSEISQYFILNSVRYASSDEMQKLYARIYPNTTAPENPKASLQKELDNLQVSRSDSSFIRLLNMVGPRFAKLDKSEIWLNGMTYRNNQIILNVEANDSTILDQLRRALEMQGLKVVVSNAERSTSGMVETRFTVEEIH